MSAFKYPIEIGDREGGRFQAVEALVDTGATFTVVPGALLRPLGVMPIETLPFELADGTVVEREVGETMIRVAGKTVSTTVVFGEDPTEALLGAHTLERAFLAVDPARHRLVPTRGLLKVLRCVQLGAWPSWPQRLRNFWRPVKVSERAAKSFLLRAGRPRSGKHIRRNHPASAVKERFSRKK